jgi:hypothetical protein
MQSLSILYPQQFTHIMNAIKSFSRTTLTLYTASVNSRLKSLPPCLTSLLLAIIYIYALLTNILTTPPIEPYYAFFLLSIPSVNPCQAEDSYHIFKASTIFEYKNSLLYLPTQNLIPNSNSQSLLHSRLISLTYEFIPITNLTEKNRKKT